MTVAGLEKYLRGLADALGSARADAAAKDLLETADQLTPFGSLTVAEFARFLGLAWEYKTTGKVSLPEPVAPRRGGTRGGGGAGKKPATPDPATVTARVKDLHDRAIDPSVTRELVEQEIRSFGGLTKAQLDLVAAGCGFTQKFKTKDDVLRALINHVMGRKGAYERADA
jgi:hypothetical protein